MTIKEYESKINELLGEIKFYAFKSVPLNKFDGIVDWRSLYESEFAIIGETEEEMSKFLIDNYIYFYSIDDLVDYIKKYYYARKGAIYDAKNLPNWALVFTKQLCVNEMWLSAQIYGGSLLNREYTIDYPENLKDGYNHIQKVDIRKKEFVINYFHFSKDDLIDIALSQALEKVKTEKFQERFYSWYCKYLEKMLLKYKRSYLWLLAQNYKDELIGLDSGDKVIVDKKVIIGPACTNVDEFWPLGNGNNSEVKNNEVKRGPTRRRKRVGAKIN